MESILPFNFNNPHYRKFNFCRHVHGMTIALRRQLQQHAFPNVSFGPFRFFEAMPWLVLAASMRVIAFNNPLIAIPAIVLASVAVLHAFLVVTQRSIELAQGQTSLGALDFTEQSRLTRAILWRIGLLMLVASIAVLAAGYQSRAPHMMAGLDGMAFDQFTDIGKFWSAAIAGPDLAHGRRGRARQRKGSVLAGRRGIRAKGPLGRRCRDRPRDHLSGARPRPGTDP
jgi:hypothetical protein